MILDFGRMTRFQLVRQLGSGGMGVVYEAIDREHNARVALKTLLRLTPEAIERFKKEFRALQDVRHPNLISLGELFEVSGSWFYTMELVEGTDFLSWVRPPPARALDEPRLRGALAQLASGLAALHAAGKVHRDVKPANVRVSPGGRVTLLDLGLVRELSSDGELSGDAVVGTTAYMAPEQAARGQVGPEADWYAFGSMLYEALAGRLPFAGGTLEVMLEKQRREPPAPSSSASSVPADLDALCQELLRFDPRARPDGARVMARLGAEPGAAEPPPRTHSSSGGAQPFVGRAAELEQLAQAFAEARRGQTVMIAVRGPTGVGKRALVRRFGERLAAQTDDLLVVTSRCYERESVPYKALDGAMDGLTRHLKRLDPVDAALVVGNEAGLVARIFPVLAQVQPVRRAAARTPVHINAADLRERAFAALRGLLVRLCARQPVVLVVEDLQWADADSIALLSALLRGPRAPQLLVLATTLESGGPAIEQLGLARVDVRTLDLPGLPAEELRKLAAQLGESLGVSVDAEAIAREADGQPLFLHELVRHAAHAGAPMGVRLDEALLRRVDGLEAEARQLLEVIVLAGAPVPLRVASLAARIPPANGLRMASVLRVSSLARAASSAQEELLEPYHDRVRTAVAGRMARAHAAELHARLAEALEGDGHSDPRLLVFHLDAGGEPARAAALAEKAAAAATAALAFERAAELYATALRLGEHTREARRRLFELMGDALAATGRGVEAADAYLAALGPDDDAARRLELRRRAAEQLLVAGEVERGLAELRGVFAEVGLRLPATPGGAVASLLWNRTKLQLRGLRWKARDPSLIPPRDLQLLELQRSVAVGLSHVEYLRGADFNLRCLLLAMKTGQPAHVANSLLLLAPLRAGEGAGRRARVDRLLGEARRIVGSLEDPSLRARLTGAEGICTYMMGSFAGALPSLEKADAALRELGGSVWQANNYRLFTIFALHLLGRYHELEAHLDRYEREAQRGDRWMEAALLRGRNILALAHGEPEKVVRALAEERALPETGFMQVHHWYRVLVRVALALHTRDAAQLAALPALLVEIEHAPLMRMQIVRSEHHWACARLALIAGDEAEVRRRMRKLAREKVGYSSARVALLAVGLDPRAERFDSAMAAAEAAGMKVYAQLARHARGDAGGTAWLRASGVRDLDGALRMLLPMRG